MTLSNQKSAAPRRVGSRHLIAATLALTSALAYQPASYAQEPQICYVVADNSSPGDISGANTQDTLIRADFQTGDLGVLLPITRTDFVPINNIEAMTSRPDFDEIIADNGGEIGRIDPATGRFTPLGTISAGGSNDFDAVVIDRRGDQTTLIAVSSGSSPVLITVELPIDPETKQSIAGTGALPATRTQPLDLSELRNIFPPNLPIIGIDGIALDGDTLYGIANNNQNLPQALVIINQNNGQVTFQGLIADGPVPTIDANTTVADIENNIPDIEDLSFNLSGDLFASSGSNGRFQNRGFFIPLDNENRPLPVTNVIPLGDLTGGTDFEASACLRAQPLPQEPPGDLLIIKRITAITTNGTETRFTEFVDQTDDRADNTLRTLVRDRLPEAGNSFPQGILQVPTTLSVGDQVEYTFYVYNPSTVLFRNAVLCDPIELPSVLDDSSIEFSAPSDGVDLNFVSNRDLARAPLAAAPEACESAINGTIGSNGQFPFDASGLNPEAGGGVVTESFDIDRGQLAVLRFSITVGSTTDTVTPTEDLTL